MICISSDAIESIKKMFNMRDDVTKAPEIDVEDQEQKEKYLALDNFFWRGNKMGNGMV